MCILRCVTVSRLKSHIRYWLAQTTVRNTVEELWKKFQFELFYFVSSLLHSAGIRWVICIWKFIIWRVPFKTFAAFLKFSFAWTDVSAKISWFCSPWTFIRPLLLLIEPRKKVTVRYFFLFFFWKRKFAFRQKGFAFRLEFLIEDLSDDIICSISQ